MHGEWLCCVTRREQQRAGVATNGFTGAYCAVGMCVQWSSDGWQVAFASCECTHVYYCVTRSKQHRPGIATNDIKHGTCKSINKPTMDCRDEQPTNNTSTCAADM